MSKKNSQVVLEKKKNSNKPFYKRWWFFIIISLLVVSAITGNSKKDKQGGSLPSIINETTKEPSTIPEVDDETKSAPEVVEYDTLQEIFMRISFDTTEDDIIRECEVNELKYDIKTYRGSKAKEYTLGYEYRSGRNPIVGDNIEVTFSTEDGSLAYAVYTKSFVSAILFNYGSYWDLRSQTPGSSTSGYYVNIVAEHNYQRVANAEKAIQFVLDNQK